MPVVAETYDGYLNDINGFHIKPEHVFAALAGATTGPIAEGSVGGGTGMICFEFKGGIGTSSRILDEQQGGYTVGVLVQANFGLRHQLRIAGLPVGLELRDDLIHQRESGSIIIIVATDAQLLPHQLKRLARRAAMGLARTGSIAGNSSVISQSRNEIVENYIKTAVESPDASILLKGDRNFTGEAAHLVYDLLQDVIDPW